MSDLTIHVCGGRVCSVTKKPHDMSVWKLFRDGGSLACKDCGVTAMDLDLMSDAPAAQVSDGWAKWRNRNKPDGGTGA